VARDAVSEPSRAVTFLRQSKHASLALLSAILLALARNGFTAQTPAVAFDHAGGFCESPFRLTLSIPTAATTIYYTTNGTTPQPATGLRYTSTIPISTTTIVRAAAFEQDATITEVGTRSYLFIPEILNQTGAQLPGIWGTNGSQSIPAHYALVLNSDVPASNILVEALGAIPSLSLVTDPENLFSSRTGIYLHPWERGADWERSASVEMFDPNGASRLQINCGVRIHGGMSRRPEESPKHSFRLSFKRRYGPAKLHFPLFGVDGPREFDELVLRAGSNDSWLDSNGEHRRQAVYVRDEWMRRSLSEMGHPSARGMFVHLYLNGLYWGLYNLCERPGAPLLADRIGAPATSYDVRKGDESDSGDSVVWNQVVTLANTGVSQDQAYRTISRLIDLPQLADYLILNFYAGNSDWDRSANWYAIRPRIAGGRFQFFVWDGERTLANLNANTLDFDDDESPMRLFQKLSENASFRALFAERSRRLLFGNGALAIGPAADRFRTLADSIRVPLAAESARWGSYRRDAHQYKSGPYEFYTVKDHWQPEVDRILTGYFPGRQAILLNQFEERGLFPQVNAPTRD